MFRRFGRIRPCRSAARIGRTDGSMSSFHPSRRTCMNRHRVKRFAGAVIAGAALAIVATASAQEPLKIGFVYVSPIGDAGWTYQHDQGRKEMEKALENRRKRARGRRCGARDPRARGRWLEARLHDIVRVHESDSQGRAAIPERDVRSRYRLQDGEKRRRLQRALLRGTLPVRHHRGQDDEDQRRGLRRRVSDSRTRPGHQCVHSGNA